MTGLGTLQFWLAVVEIIAVNILLSGDNAVVIALACRNLSPRQRRMGVFWGVLGAIVLRIVLTLFAMGLLVYPWLRLVGGALLVWIGIKLIAEDAGAEKRIKASDRLLTAVGTIIVADLVMSIDNVVAVAAAAKGSAALLIFGLVISIPLVVVGSQIIMKLVERFPVLVLAGGGLLGYIAGDMAVEDPVVKPWIDANAATLGQLAAPVLFGVVVIAGEWLVRRRGRTRSG